MIKVYHSPHCPVSFGVYIMIPGRRTLYISQFGICNSIFSNAEMRKMIKERRIELIQEWN